MGVSVRLRPKQSNHASVFMSSVSMAARPRDVVVTVACDDCVEIDVVADGRWGRCEWAVVEMVFGLTLVAVVDAMTTLLTVELVVDDPDVDDLAVDVLPSATAFDMALAAATDWAGVTVTSNWLAAPTPVDAVDTVDVTVDVTVESGTAVDDGGGKLRSSFDESTDRPLFSSGIASNMR